jgi:hypothetical protein
MYMYLLATRPDLAFFVCLIARYMERPTEMHLVAKEISKISQWHHEP